MAGQGAGRIPILKMIFENKYKSANFNYFKCQQRPWNIACIEYILALLESNLFPNIIIASMLLDYPWASSCSTRLKLQFLLRKRTVGGICHVGCR